MKTRAVAEIAGVEMLTLNLWISRGLVPGVKVGPRGHRRDFDLGTATHILIMSELVRLGLGAPAASEWAARARFCDWLTIANRPARDPVPGGPANLLMIPRPAGFQLAEGHSKDLVLRASSASKTRHDGDYEHGDVYIVIHTKGSRERMREAFEEWEQSHADEE